MGKQKLYAYVDESGQDTEGGIFVVSIVVLENERDAVRQRLEEIEQRTGKGAVKWHKSKHEFRRAYIEALAALLELRHRAFVEVFYDTKQYLDLTALATAKAILKNARPPYKVTVFVDGLSIAGVAVFSRTLRDLHIQTRKIRGVRKDENDALIRLADNLCGLVRDAREKTPWAVEALERLVNAGIVEEL